MVSSSSASHSVRADAGDAADLREEDVLEEVEDSWEDDFREIITRGRVFWLRLGTVECASLLAATHHCCRKGRRIDASLEGGEVVVQSRCFLPALALDVVFMTCLAVV